MRLRIRNPGEVNGKQLQKRFSISPDNSQIIKRSVHIGVEPTTIPTGFTMEQPG